LQLTGKISLELNSNSSWLLEYGHKSSMLPAAAYSSRYIE